ncbi:MAG: L-lactate permease [Micavibrio sp.]|nr:MAG: L-lactate permease [Micavibrio sp.]
MDALKILAALSPILSIFTFLVLLRWPAKYAMPLTALITAALAGAVWQVPAIRIAAAAIEGLMVAASIIWIILGAIFLLKVMSASGALERIRNGFTVVSPDRRVQLILIAWLFGAFIEGAAGFGTPAVICAPLLIALGFPAMAAVVLTLIANSSPVSFGAVGTPVLIGMQMGLEAGEKDVLSHMHITDQTLGGFVETVAVQALVMDLMIGSFVPILLCVLMTFCFGRNKSIREGLEIWRFALLAGLAFFLPALAVAYFFGPEFPSLLGGLIGIGIVLLAIKFDFLLPKTQWDDFCPQFKTLQSPVPEKDKNKTASPSKKITLAYAWLPYLLITLVLVLTRIDAFLLKDMLKAMALEWNNILHTDISARIEPLYLPGTVFLLTALIAAKLYGMRRRDLVRTAGETFSALQSGIIALCAAVPTVRIFVYSDINTGGVDSMPIELAAMAIGYFGSGWSFFAPFVGVLGTFISGSATFSNMMFSLLQFSAASEAGLPPRLILAAQLLGANAGNMIAVVNVVAVAAVTQLSGREGQIIRYTILPMLLLALSAGIITTVFIRFPV